MVGRTRFGGNLTADLAKNCMAQFPVQDVNEAKEECAAETISDFTPKADIDLQNPRAGRL